MNKRKALKLALEALDCICSPLHVCEIEKIGSAMKAIREALAQPEQKPVACPFPCGWKRLFEIIVADGAFLARSLEEGEAITEHQREVVMHMIGYAKDMALHGMEATPPQRTWVGLDDENMKELRDANFDLLYGVRWAERKLREKNGC